MLSSDGESARETWGSLKIEVRYARGLPPSREDPETHRSTPCKYAVRICAGGVTKITRYVACDDQGCVFKETLRFDIATAYTTSPVVIEVLRQGDSALNFCSASVELHQFNRFLPWRRREIKMSGDVLVGLSSTSSLQVARHMHTW
ncbi:hypothetical protein P43SY_008720 [Pythium insidiosum]|uniref:C2 domain-containing protein n=1 Tax=Pythium insidiosum TaxID=114742 RepID=A0AAD5Q2L1_PYTIN|nr:hypothetical protein P43SY_008720 [Pythium insidiosum]